MHGSLSRYLPAVRGRVEDQPVTISRKAFRVRADDKLVGRLMALFDASRNSKFEHEAAARHAVRSALCLTGVRWIVADTTAATAIEKAFRRLGAQRPTWAEGQPTHTEEGFAPIEFTRCIRCGGKIVHGELRNGWSTKFCSNLCSNLHREMIDRHWGERRSLAEYHAALAVIGERIRQEKEIPCIVCGGRFYPRHSAMKCCSRACAEVVIARKNRERRLPKRHCEHCERMFHPRSAEVRFCSKKCRDAFRAIGTKHCEWCAKTFQPIASRVRFCCQSCSARWRVSMLPLLKIGV